jgi:hypothetical protein
MLTPKKVGNPTHPPPPPQKKKKKNKCKNYERADKNQTEGHEIKPNPSKDRAMHERDNPSFSDEFIKAFTFFLTVQFI